MMRYQQYQSFKMQSSRNQFNSVPKEHNQGSNFTVFVDNLPNSVGMPWFRKIFSNFGNIGESHIPNKRSRRTGHRFGFIRFNNRREVDIAIAKANGLWVGKRNLIVERASYDRGHVNRNVETYPRDFKSSHGVYLKLDPNSGDTGKSSKLVERNFTINVQPVASEWLTRSAVAKLKEITTTEMVQKAFSVNNFKDVWVRHLGGLDMIITFDSKEDRILALNSPLVKSWFNGIKLWNGEAAGTSRLVWIKCRGMPLNAWGCQTFKRIGEIWGTFITLDQETLKEESFEVGRMLIATDNIQSIDDWINITVRGKNYRVKVWEEVCDDFFNEKSVREWVKSHLPLSESHPIATDFTHPDDIGIGERIQEVQGKSILVELRNCSQLNSVVEAQQKDVALADRGDNNDGKDVGHQKVFEVDTLIAANTEGVNVVVVEKTISDALAEVDSRSKNKARKVGSTLEIIMEEDEESMVGETPNIEMYSPTVNEQLVEKLNQDQGGAALVEPNHCGPISKVEVPKVPSAREKRARIRKDIRDILGTLENEYQAEEVRAISSDHSDSINTEDIQRRNLAIIKGFENAVNISKRLGVIHHESDEMVIKRMAHSHAQRHGETLNKRVLPATMS